MFRAGGRRLCDATQRDALSDQWSDGRTDKRIWKVEVCGVLDCKYVSERLSLLEVRNKRITKVYRDPAF